MQDYKYGYKSTRQARKCATKPKGCRRSLKAYIGELVHFIIGTVIIFGVSFWVFDAFLNSFL